MSLSSSLSSAIAGLSVTSRRAEVISSNVANALTQGYARRDLQIGSRGLAGGPSVVQVTGLRREVDMAVLTDRRMAQAASGGTDRRAAFLQAFEAAVGTSDQPRSLTGRIAGLETALIQAAARPDSEAVLGGVVASARGLADQIASAADTVQGERRAADRRIGVAGVDALNSGLVAIADANEKIRTLTTAGRDATALMDERQRLVDDLSSIVPLREVTRPDGQVALFSTGGAALLDGRPARFDFAPTGQIGADMTLQGGALSGLRLNGVPVGMGVEGSPMGGGSLAADFDIRDRLGVQAQARLDAVARDLIERTADPALDPTLAPGAPGLFTDAGAGLDPLAETGLAQRLRINAAVDPGQGGAFWRIRAGLGATQPGPGGDTARITALQQALSATRPTASGGFMAADRSLAMLGADLLSVAATERLDAEAEASFATARTEALLSVELSQGIDTDREMQDLLLVEQAFRANARVIQTVDELMTLLLGLGA